MTMSGPQIERRFLLDPEEVQEFFAQARPWLDLEIHDPARPIAYARSTYFDTPTFAYLSSFSGPVARRVRIREYAWAGDPVEPPVLSGRCAFTVKESIGSVRKKTCITAPPDALRALLVGTDVPPDLQAARQCLAIGELTPVATTWYRRTSYATAGALVRVTLDEATLYCRPVALGRPGERAEPSGVVGRGPGRILELKYTGEPPSWLVTAACGLCEAEGFSKFRAAMLAVGQKPAAPEEARSSWGSPRLVHDVGKVSTGS